MIATGGKGAIVDREGPGGPKWSTPWVCIHPSILPQAEAPVEPWEVPVDAVVGGSREEEARGGGPGEEAPPPEALVEERRGFIPDGAIAVAVVAFGKTSLFAFADVSCNLDIARGAAPDRSRIGG